MARPLPSGPPAAPIAQRLTIRYAKRGRMRFASHRDLARAIERGVRKAGLPVGYSAGFSPHPKISYPGGAPTGSASEAEYLELSLTRECDPADVGRRLDAALPDGIDVIEVVEADAKSVAGRLEASEWEVIWSGVDLDEATAAVTVFLAAPNVEVERLTNKGLRRFDARAAVVKLDVDRRAVAGPGAGCAILRMIVRHMTPAVRPDDILAALRQSMALAPASPPLVTRLWQGPLDGLAAAETGMILATEAAEPSGPGVPTAAASLSAEQNAGQGIDKALCLEAGSAGSAPAGQAGATEQLPRGARGQLADPRAREPNGRDCPDARNRATERTVQF
jgi:radical SAM-linked protein